MTTKQFKKKLKKMIENSGEFVTDSIDMNETVDMVKAEGWDDAVCLAGKDHTEIFLLIIKKV